MKKSGEDSKFNYETGELRDWKGRLVACVNLDQRDEDTRYREIFDYIEAYRRALSDIEAERDECASKVA